MISPAELPGSTSGVLSEASLNLPTMPSETRVTDDALLAPTPSRFVAPAIPRRQRITKSIEREIVDRYQRGESSQTVADGCGVSRTAVLRVLHSSGTEVKPTGRRYDSRPLDA